MALIILAVLVAACGQSPTGSGQNPALAETFPAADWVRAQPDSLGLDPARLSTMVNAARAGNYGSIQAIVVVRHGKVAAEEYPAWTPGVSHTLQSVTKSVTSLLVGIAVGDGKIKVDNPVLPYFSRYASIANVDARKEALTVRNLLTMRTSMDFYEQPYPGSPLEQLNNSGGDWTKFILDRTMIGQPGSAWAYNSGAAILLGSLVRETTGSDFAEFARIRLFDPIGITSERWFLSLYDQLPHGGGGLHLTPLDLARIGQLVLHRGRWRETQVVPASWIDASIQPTTRGAPVYWSNYNSGYGYLWWLFPTTRGGSDSGVITASGAQGQWLFIVPSQDLVVAIAGGADNNSLELLYDHLLSLVSH